MKAIWSLVLLICFCGCSPQKDLADRLAGADRAVFANTIKGYEHEKITVTGADLNKVIQAIANGQKLDGYGLAAAPDFRLEFFKGSERITNLITSAGQVFWIGNTPYKDTTKALEELYEKARQERHTGFSQ